MTLWLRATNWKLEPLDAPRLREESPWIFGIQPHLHRVPVDLVALSH